MPCWHQLLVAATTRYAMKTGLMTSQFFVALIIPALLEIPVTLKLSGEKQRIGLTSAAPAG